MRRGELKKLAERLGVSYVTVNNALKFRTRSNVSNMIRKAALENGGALIGAKSLKVAMGSSGEETTAE